MVSCNGDGKEFQGLVMAYACAFWPEAGKGIEWIIMILATVKRRPKAGKSVMTKTAKWDFFVLH